VHVRRLIPCPPRLSSRRPPRGLRSSTCLHVPTWPRGPCPPLAEETLPRRRCRSAPRYVHHFLNSKSHHHLDHGSRLCQASGMTAFSVDDNTDPTRQRSSPRPEPLRALSPVAAIRGSLWSQAALSDPTEPHSSSPGPVRGSSTVRHAGHTSPNRLTRITIPPAAEAESSSVSAGVTTLAAVGLAALRGSPWSTGFAGQASPDRVPTPPQSSDLSASVNNSAGTAFAVASGMPWRPTRKVGWASPVTSSPRARVAAPPEASPIEASAVRENVGVVSPTRSSTRVTRALDAWFANDKTVGDPPTPKTSPAPRPPGPK